MTQGIRYGYQLHSFHFSLFYGGDARGGADGQRGRPMGGISSIVYNGQVRYIRSGTIFRGTSVGTIGAARGGTFSRSYKGQVDCTGHGRRGRKIRRYSTAGYGGARGQS